MARSELEILQQAVSRLAILVAEYEPRLAAVCDELREGLRSEDRARLERAAQALQRRILQLGPPPPPAHLLRHFLGVLTEGDGPWPARLLEIGRDLEDEEDGARLLDLAEEAARLCRQTLSRDANAARDGTGAARICALLVAEILQQLMERVTLPQEFGPRVERLRARLEEGVRAGQWEGLLREVAELANDIRLRLHRERSETHRFLRQMDARLVEIDRHLSGHVQRNEAVRAQGEALQQAMRDEVDGLHRQLDDADDMERLRQLVRARMERVNAHLTRFKALQEAQHQADREEVSALRRRLAELEAETRALRKRLEEQRQKALVDVLTGIPNRLAFEERMAQEYARWKRFGEPLSVVLWDVDRFKAINDRFGHQAGDKVLKVIAGKLAEGIRETDFLARFGGEEFVLVMPGADLEGARKAADKLRERIARTPFRFKGEPLTITLSAGIAQFRGEDDPQAVLARADEALYRAKRGGRNRCEAERLNGSNE